MASPDMSTSALAHERRFGPVPTTSGLPLTTDIMASVQDGREGPKSEVELLWICGVAEVILCNSLGIFPACW
jgi:hypothetical protein